MKRKLVVVLVLAVVVASLSLSLSKVGYADAPSAAAANDVAVDVTINANGGVSIGGIDLATLGVLPLDPQVTAIAQRLQDAHLTVQGQQVELDVQQTPTVKIDWTPASRQTAANLALRYGVALSPDFLTRMENWISSSNVDLTVRFANEASKPAKIALTTPVQVDIAGNGQLTIEKLPLAAAVTQATVQTMEMGGKQATACWNKGKLTAKVDGADLPTITLNPEGVQVLNQALNLNLTSIKEPLLAARFGVDLSLAGAAHSSDSCTE